MARSLSDQVPPATGVSFSNAVKSCLPTGFVVMDGDRRIAFLNEKAAAWLGLDPAAVLGRAWDSTGGWQQRVFEQAWSTREPVCDFPIESNGCGSLHARVLRQAGPLPDGVVLLLTETGPANQWEMELARLDRLVTLGTLSAGLAHEVRNALVSTKTFVDVALERDPANELAAIVPRELQHIDGLLGQMLRQAAPERPEWSAPRPVDIHETLDLAIRLVGHRMRARGVAITRDYASDPGSAPGDAGQLQQVFVNLLLNAAEAMAGGGQLTIRTCRNDGRLAVSFEDTGMGIHSDHLQRVFEPFFTTKPEGSGLGLAICRTIVLRHGGEIRAENRAGGGAVFTLELPVEAEGVLESVKSIITSP